MNVTVEILHLENDQEPKVMHTLSHECHSLETVVAAAQGIVDSLELPEQPNGYRITTEAGIELYGWRDRVELQSIEKQGASDSAT